jgi:hypothetical protein
MGIIKRNVWLAAAVFGAVLLVFGGFFVYKALDAKALITAELMDEAVITGDDAAIPGVMVLDAATAQAESDVIKAHTFGKYGPYSEMDREDPNRATYLKGVTLRNALNMAVMGYGIADLAMATGAVIMLIGFAAGAMGAPILYFAWGRVPAATTRRDIRGGKVGGNFPTPV